MRPRDVYNNRRRSSPLRDRFPGVRTALTRVLVAEVALPDRTASELMPAVDQVVADAIASSARPAALEVECPHCGAVPTEPCTSPGRVHSAREYLVMFPERVVEFTDAYRKARARSRAL